MNYENYISLGYFCGVAEDLEKLGLRNMSSPFDWGISDLKGIIELFENKFDGFMDYTYLKQSSSLRYHYLDSRYNFFSFHDFSQYKTLAEQYSEVHKTYQRRVDRFLKKICNPTLFFRYISNETKNEEGKSVELKYIENNLDYIYEIIQSYNKCNDIIFIGDEHTKSDIIKIYHVDIEKGDVVSRSPIINNPELYPIVKRFKVENQEDNIERYKKKQQAKKHLINRMIRLLKVRYERMIKKVYIHSEVYNIPGK